MHSTPPPKILLALAICAILAISGIFGQVKPTGEVDLTKCWSHTFGESTGAALASDGNSVYLGLGGAKIEALALDGKRLWTTELGGEIASNILPRESGLFMVTSTLSADAARPRENVLRSLSKETGITNWTLKLAEAEGHFLGGFDTAVIVVSKSGVIQSIDAKSGSVRWKREIAERFVAEPAFNGTKVMVAAAGKQIFDVSLISGEIELLRKTLYGMTALGVGTSGLMLAGDERGNVSALFNGSDKATWKFKSGGEISNILAVSDNFFVTSHDNFVYFLDARDGGVEWKKRLPGRASQIALVMDKYVLASGIEEPGAKLIDLSNGKIAGQIALTDDENLVHAPVVSNGLIFLLTDQAAYAYGLNGCSSKN